MRKIIIAFSTFLIIGCASNGYEEFYHPYANAEPVGDLELLREDEEVEVFGTDNLERDINILRSKNYAAIGYSSFNGGYEDLENAKTQAKKVKATHVLVSSDFTNTQSTTSALLMPTVQTTQHSGTIYSNGSSGGYIGSSTTYGTSVVPFTVNQQRYDQTAVYFVKRNKLPRFGLYLLDLTPELRLMLERNTGALINIVVENTPAFAANLLPGDVITAIDGKVVSNGTNALKIMGAIPESKDKVDFTILRQGSERQIEVDL